MKNVTCKTCTFCEEHQTEIGYICTLPNHAASNNWPRSICDSGSVSACEHYISKFPQLDGGWCDGMGCGGQMSCFCKEYLAMREEFQRVYDKPFTEKWVKRDEDCIRVEEIWRFAHERSEEYYETQLSEMQDRINALMDVANERGLELYELRKQLK